MHITRAFLDGLNEVGSNEVHIIDLIDSSNIRIVGDLTDIGNAVGRYSVPTTVEILGYREAGVVGDNYNVVVSLEVDEPEPEPEPEEAAEEAPEEP